MNKQISLSTLNDELLQVRTKKKEFLEQIERIVPWGEWLSLIKPCYYKGERGNKPYDLELMLRIYLIQNLYDLADEATVNEVIDSRAFSDFCGVESSNQVPDGDTLGRFRNLLIKNDLQEKLFKQVVELLTKRGLILKKGINRRPSQSKNLSTRAKGQIKRREREKSSVRAKVEHVFAVVKKQLRYRKTRYRGLRKQTAKLNMMFALANLILADRPCLAA